MVKRRVLAFLLGSAVAASACSAIIGINDLTPGEPEGSAAGDGSPANGRDATATNDGSSSSDGGPGADGGVHDGGDAGCGDVLSSADHCGRCGHSCLGGACSDGGCQPVELATNQGTVAGVVIDSTHVYFTSLSRNVVARVSKSGGTVDTLASGSSAVHFAKRLAVNATHVYWANADLFNGAISRCPLAGCTGAPEVLATPDEPSGIALSSTHVYWADRQGTVVKRKPLTAGAEEVVSNPPDLPVAVAVDGTTAFFVQDFSGRVHKSAPDGGAILVGVNGQSGRDIVLDATFAYWGSEVDPGEPGRISRAPRSGSGPTDLIGEAQGEPMGLALDGARIYWTAQRKQTDGTVISGGVYSCPLAGCVPAMTTIAAAQDLPRGIAVDADAIYWGTNGRVLKLAKP